MEWCHLKELVIAPLLSRKRQREEGEDLSWRTICPHLHDKPNILALAQLMNCFTASSSMCERVFSQMKLLKNDRRSVMTANNMTNQLRIMLHGQTIADFCPDDALFHF